MGAALPVVAAIGAIGSLYESNRANNTARSQLGLQKTAAQNQAELFGQTSPYYSQLLQALGQNAGISPAASQPMQMVGGRTTFPGLERAVTGGQMAPAPAAAPAALGPNSFQQQAGTILGAHATPGDLARYKLLEDSLNRAGIQAQHSLAFGMGNRMPFGGSLGASAQTALASNLGAEGARLRLGLAGEAEQNYQSRLQQLANALNPGLSAGPISADIAGRAGQQAAGMGQYFGGQAGGAIQNYLQYQAMQKFLQQQAPGGNMGSVNLGTPGFAQSPYGASYQGSTPEGLAQTPALPSLGYSFESNF